MNDIKKKYRIFEEVVVYPNILILINNSNYIYYKFILTFIFKKIIFAIFFIDYFIKLLNWKLYV